MAAGWLILAAWARARRAARRAHARHVAGDRRRHPLRARHRGAAERVRRQRQRARAADAACSCAPTATRSRRRSAPRSSRSGPTAPARSAARSSAPARRVAVLAALVAGFAALVRRAAAPPRRHLIHWRAWNIASSAAPGLRVSALTLGTMTFGGRATSPAVGDTDVAGATRQIDICLDAASTSSTPPTSTRAGCRRRSSARRSSAAATACCSPPRRACRWATAPTTPASRATT